MHNGWIRLYRKLMDHDIYPDPFLLKLWLHCLLKASHKEREQLVGRQVVVIMPGQFVTGRDALASEFNRKAKKEHLVSPRTLWRWMKLLEKCEMLSIKSATKYSVITILNWLDFQSGDQQVSNKCPTKVQQVSTNKNGNNENKKNMSILQAEQFNTWWNLYNVDEGRAICERMFNSLLNTHSFEIIFEGTKRYLKYRQYLKDTNQFVPNIKLPSTFLNGMHFLDKYNCSLFTTEEVIKQQEIDLNFD